MRNAMKTGWEDCLNRDNPRWRLAIHEAAHGIACLATNTSLFSLEVDADNKAERCRHCPSSAATPRLRPAIYLNNTKSGKGSLALCSLRLGQAAPGGLSSGTPGDVAFDW